MKIRFTLSAMVLVVAVFFASCTKDNGGNEANGVKGKYIINYGSYSGAKGTVSLFDIIFFHFLN